MLDQMRTAHHPGAVQGRLAAPCPGTAQQICCLRQAHESTEGDMSPLPFLPPCCRTVRARRKSNLVDVLAALQQRPNEADIERWDVTLSFDTLKSALQVLPGADQWVLLTMHAA